MPYISDLRYNWVEVRLSAIDAAEMRELVIEAWCMVVPKSVAAAYLAPSNTVALGWRPHSGWAVVVAVVGPTEDAAPVVTYRQRVELLDSSLPRQPYHAAVDAGLSLDDAEVLIRQVEQAATDAVTSATAAAVAELSRSNLVVRRAGVAAAGSQVPRELGRILGSHPLLHAAEGQLFRRAVIEGSARAGLEVITVDPKTAADLQVTLAAMGKVAGPPWQKDHREAAAAALAAL
jgi:hypothetical protein